MGWHKPTQDSFAGLDFGRWTEPTQAPPAKVTKLVKLPAPAIAPMRTRTQARPASVSRVPPDPQGELQMRRSLEVKRLLLAGVPRVEAIKRVYGEEC